MKNTKVTIMLVFLCAILLLTGCGTDRKGTVAGTNYYYPEKEKTESQIEKEEVITSVKAELGPEYYMVILNDMTLEYLFLEQVQSGNQYLYLYSLTTKFQDKYGNNTSVSAFEPGQIITIGEKDSKGHLKSAQITDEVWEYEDVVRFEVDEERGVFKIADTKYSFEEDLYVISAGKKIKVSDIKKDDKLRVIGKNKEILSVTITTGQGTIALKNTELFEDSFIQIGSKIFAEITGEMELEVPEGVYTITVANKGYGGSKEYEVVRDTTTVVDLEELKGDGPKSGKISFVIGTTDINEDAEIIFRIDGTEVDYENPIELTYGIHSIEAESFGYETYAKKLFVNSEQAAIVIALDTESSSAETVKDKSEAEVNTNLAGSLAGSTSNNNADNDDDNESSTDELVEALKEVLSEDSSTDYLSTLTSLLGNIMN